MSRFLLVVPPLVGHINPMVAVAAELTARGHRVAWAGHGALLDRLIGAEAEIHDCGVLPLEGAAARPAHLRGPAALKFLWEQFQVPLADRMAGGVAAAIEAFAPDAVVADQQAIAGGLVAERLGLPWFTSATTSAELVDPLATMPKVRDWVAGLVEGLRQRIGAPGGTADPRFSPHGILAFSTAALLGPAGLAHNRVAYVGPAIGGRPSTVDFPWHWPDPKLATVLVTLGTANPELGSRFLTACATAVHALADRMQAVVVDPSGTFRTSNPNVLVREYVPQLALLERVDAVVCHAGHNTVCEALWHGVPLVVAPIRDDQPIVANQVVEAGAGVRVRFDRVTAPQLGLAMDTVIDPRRHYLAGADRIRQSFRAAGGAAAAARQLENWTIAAEAERDLVR